MVNDYGKPNTDQCRSFKELLKILSINVQVADRIIDWMDSDSIPELTDSEAGAKNAALDSVDELLLIPGISKEDYDKLLPYVTVYGSNNNLPLINVNSAQEPVLRSLYDVNDKDFTIDENKAKDIVQHRNNNPFMSIQDFNRFKGTGFSANQITVQPELLTIRSTASSEGVKRVIETVLDTTNKVQYWKEY